MSEGRCQYCGRRILWGELPGGHRLPYDPKPDPAGSLVLERAKSESGVQLGRTRVRFVARTELPEFTRYMSHLTSCPQRPRRRRKRAGRRGWRPRQSPLFPVG